MMIRRVTGTYRPYDRQADQRCSPRPRRQWLRFRVQECHVLLVDPHHAADAARRPMKRVKTTPTKIFWGVSPRLAAALFSVLWAVSFLSKTKWPARAPLQRPHARLRFGTNGDARGCFLRTRRRERRRRAMRADPRSTAGRPWQTHLPRQLSRHPFERDVASRKTWSEVSRHKGRRGRLR